MLTEGQGEGHRSRRNAAAIRLAVAFGILTPMEIISARVIQPVQVIDITTPVWGEDSVMQTAGITGARSTNAP